MVDINKAAMDNTLQPNSVESCITQRKTCKVILPIDLRQEQQASWSQAHQDELVSMLSASANAPFHKKAHEQYCSNKAAGAMDAPMPWRFHVVGSERCTELLAFLKEQTEAQNADPKWVRAWQSKIKEMLSGCGVLVQATWLPDPMPENTSSVQEDPLFSDKNIEHVAAAASAVQNLLLAAQSHGWSSYWSSGGILRNDDVFKYLNIDTSEKLLGSIFLNPKPHPEARLIDGGLRDQRGDLSGWVRWA